MAFELAPASETCRALREFGPRLETFGFKREHAEVHEALASVYMPWSKPRREHERAALALWRELGHTQAEISQRRSGLRRATKAAIIAAVIVTIYLLLSLVALPLL